MPPHDGQPESSPGSGSGPRRVGAPEPVEGPGGGIRGHARAVVAHGEQDRLAAGLGPHLDGRGGVGVGQRVGQQVGQHLPQPGLVALHEHRLGRVQRHLPRGMRGRGVEHRVGGQGGKVDRFQGQGPALVEAGQQQQVLDQAAHAGALLADAAHDVVELVRVDRPLAPQVGEPADGGDGGAQLVGRVGDELAQLRLGGSLLVEHHVEGPGEVVRLGPGGTAPDPPRPVAAGDRIGDLGHLGDRPQAEA